MGLRHMDYFWERTQFSLYNLCLVVRLSPVAVLIMSLPKLTEMPMEAKALPPRAAGEGSVSRESLSKGQGLPVGMMPRTNRWYMMVLAP